MPPWTDVQADVDLVCKLHERLNDVYDVQAIDVVVVGIFHQACHAWECLCYQIVRSSCLMRHAQDLAINPDRDDLYYTLAATIRPCHNHAPMSAIYACSSAIKAGNAGC